MNVAVNAHGFFLEVGPNLGGAILHFSTTIDGRITPILRSAPVSPTSVLETACFPLVPYVNRIRDGRFFYEGREIQLRPNMSGGRHPLHGQGWLSAWEVDWRDEASVGLRFLHQADEWPWRYEARQSFRLEPDGLFARISCRDLSDEPMPCGLGFHPYFPCDAQTSLCANVGHVWTVDEEIMPVARIPVEGRYALNGPVCARDLDNGYDGWDGSAHILYPNYELHLEGPGCSHFQLYSPASGGVFVAEPVSHANDVLNWPRPEWEAGGIHILAPSEEMTLSMRLSVRPIH